MSHISKRFCLLSFLPPSKAYCVQGLRTSAWSPASVLVPCLSSHLYPYKATYCLALCGYSISSTLPYYATSLHLCSCWLPSLFLLNKQTYIFYDQAQALLSMFKSSWYFFPSRINCFLFSLHIMLVTTSHLLICMPVFPTKCQSTFKQEPQQQW